VRVPGWRSDRDDTGEVIIIRWLGPDIHHRGGRDRLSSVVREKKRFLGISDFVEDIFYYYVRSRLKRTEAQFDRGVTFTKITIEPGLRVDTDRRDIQMRTIR